MLATRTHRPLGWTLVLPLVAASLALLVPTDPAIAAGSGTYVYVNDDRNGPNTVSAFSVGADGALSPVAGSPFATGGNGAAGGFFGGRPQTLAQSDGRLYVANKLSGTVSGFAIDPGTGALTPLPGSPYATGLPGHPLSGSMVVDETRDLLFVAFGTSLAIYPIGADGSLLAPSVVPIGSWADGLDISSDGAVLAVTQPHHSRMQVYRVGAGGTLTEAPGSPHPGNFTDAAFAPSGARLFTGLVSGGVRSYAVAATGALTLEGSGAPGANLQSIAVSPDGTRLFASDVTGRRVWSFLVGSDGSLTNAAGSPVPTGVSDAWYTTGISTDPTGARLYVLSTCATGCADRISVFEIGAAGSLSPIAGSPFATGRSGFPTALDFYGGGDTTPPSIVGTSDPAPNSHGWNAGPVTVSFRCEDEVGGSGVATCTAPVVLSLEGADQSVTGTATDVAGNEATVDVSGINIDLTPPTLAGQPTTAPNANGWYKGDVTVAWTCDDALSGMDGACPSGSLLDGEGADLEVTASVTDKAGHETEVTVGGVDIDRTDPVVAYSGAAASYTVDQQVSISCSASDALSGIGSHTCADVTGPAYSFGVGTHSFEASAIDRAGNDASGSVRFDVAVTFASLSSLTQTFVDDRGVANSLNTKLKAAASAPTASAKAGQLRAYRNELAARSGKSLTAEEATILSTLSQGL